MHFRALLLFILVLWNNHLFSQDVVEAAQSTAASGAVLQFESEILDYGILEYDANSLREFKFTNTGSLPLTITKVQGQCGCTTTVIDGKPGWPTEPILPGKSGVIKVKYDTKRPGKFDKKIMVYANIAGDQKLITIKGEVKTVK